ncbi:NAD(P)H-dependent oxidoreductase [Saccharopolyspora taberi]|uniref:NAD(P)H-dependent oxidoreductase n=1 Tax=Saccharopolyspora taberi TaxID=60895 RepID=A0ABN3V3Q0_9PSEU
MTETPLRLAVIVGSTREGRFAETVSRWFAEQVRVHNDFDVDVVDLADVGLPPAHPAELTAELRDFSARIDAADAFVIVTPEYNHGYPASLKFAIDSAYAEWNAKPVGFVSYGGISGGLRAVEQLRQIMAELHTVTVRDTVSFHGAWGQFDENGDPRDPEGVNQAAKKMLDQLLWWGRATRDARTTRPYAA